MELAKGRLDRSYLRKEKGRRSLCYELADNVNERNMTFMTYLPDSAWSQ